MALNFRKFIEGINIFPKATSTVDSAGDVDFSTDIDKLNLHNGTSSSPLVTESHAATLTNKTIDADSNTISNIDNADIKAAAAIDATKIADGSVTSTEFQYLDGVTSNIQDQLDNTLDNTLLDSNIYVGNASNVATAVAVTGDISVSNTGVVAIATGVIVNADINASAAIDATKIADGSVSNTEFQYINGLTSDAQTQLTTNATNISNHTGAASGVHGVTGNVVGTSDIQSLSNKTLGNTNSLTVKDANLVIQDDVDTSKQAGFEASAISPANTRTYTLPDASGTLTLNDATQTLANKTINNTNTITISDSNLTIQDNSDATKQLKIEASGITTATTRTLTAPDANTTILGTDATQVVTNKDIDGGTASNTSRITVPKAAKATLDALTRKEATLVFGTDTDKLYVDDGSVLKPVGSGSGGINFMNLSSTWSADNTDNVDAETSVGAWVTFADAASATPVDLTGGTATNLTLSRTTTAGEILDGTASFKLVKTANDSQGQGASCLFNVPPAYQGKFATISIPYKIITGSVVSGDLSIWIYDVTNSILITPLNQMVGGSSGTISATFPVSPSAGTPANQQYRVGIYFGSTSATAVTMVFDDVSVSPQQEVVVGNITEWVSYTPSFSAGWGSVTNAIAYYRQVGSEIEVRGSVTDGTPAASLASISLPNSYQLNTNFLTLNNTSANPGNQVGSWRKNGGDFHNGALVTAPSTDASVVYVAHNDQGGSGITPTDGNTALVSSGGNSNTTVVFEFSVPVIGLTVGIPTTVINPNIGASQSYTPVITGLGTVSSPSFEFRQVGEYIEIQGNVTSGTPSASPTTFTLPNGYTVASTVPSNSLVGSAVRDNAAGGDFTVVAAAPGDQTLGIGHNAAVNPLAIQNGNAIIASGDLVSINCRIKVGGLSANGVINQGQVAYLREEQTSGTNGGTFTSGAWQTRVLNTEVDPDQIVTLSSNQFTLQPGKYRISASAPAAGCDGHKAKLYNITDASDAIIGTSENSQSGQSNQTRSLVDGIITITSSKTFEIQHRCLTTAASNGLGVQVGIATEVYTQVEITKLR